MPANPIRAALYGRLNHASITSLLSAPDAIFHRLAPQSASAPYVVFQKQAGRPAWTFGDHLQWDLWTVKAIARGQSASVAEEIAAAVDARLTDAPLVITARLHLYLRRQSDVDYAETDAGVLIHHVGATFALVTQPT